MVAKKIEGLKNTHPDPSASLLLGEFKIGAKTRIPGELKRGFWKGFIAG